MEGISHRTYNTGMQHPDVPPILRVGRSDPYYLEQFKALRAKFENIVDEKKTKVVAITSAIAGPIWPRLRLRNTVARLY